MAQASEDKDPVRKGRISWIVTYRWCEKRGQLQEKGNSEKLNVPYIYLTRRIVMNAVKITAGTENRSLGLTGGAGHRGALEGNGSLHIDAVKYVG